MGSPTLPKPPSLALPERPDDKDDISDHSDDLDDVLGPGEPVGLFLFGLTHCVTTNCSIPYSCEYVRGILKNFSKFHIF